MNFHNRKPGANLNGANAIPPPRRTAWEKIEQPLIKAACLVQAGCRYANNRGYKSWITNGGLGLGAVVWLMGAPELMTTVLLAFIIVVGQLISAIGGPDTVEIFRNRKPLTAAIPMPVTDRSAASKFVDDTYNSRPLARFCRTEKNPFFVPIFRKEVINDIFETRNPNTGFTMRDDHGAIVGFGIVAPMPRTSLVRLLSGAIAFADIKASDVLPEPDRDRCVLADFHLPRKTPNWTNGASDRDVRNLGGMLHGMFHLLEKHCFVGRDRNREITVFAMAKHTRGCALLDQLGFVRDDALSGARRDRRKVFRKTVTRGTLYALRCELNISEADLSIEIPKYIPNKH